MESVAGLVFGLRMFLVPVNHYLLAIVQFLRSWEGCPVVWHYNGLISRLRELAQVGRVRFSDLPTIIYHDAVRRIHSVSRHHVEVFPAAAFSINSSSASVMRISKRTFCRSSAGLGGLPIRFFSIKLLYGEKYSPQPLQRRLIYRTISVGEQGMIVISCQHESTKRHGKDRKGNRRFRCLLCGATFAEQAVKPLGDMRITMKEAITPLACCLRE